MKLCHNVKVSIFEYKDNNPEKIEQTLRSLFPFNIDKNLTKKKATGFNEREIVMFEVFLENNGLINKFIKKLNSKLSNEQKQLLLRQENRLDEHLNLFIRLDKEKLLKDEFHICDSGNCFHIRLSIASYPKKRDIALKIINQMFSE